MDSLIKYVVKVAGILNDRRFIVAAATIVGLFVGSEGSEYEVYFQSIGTLIMGILMVLGWTIRPPSGLNYQESGKQAVHIHLPTGTVDIEKLDKLFQEVVKATK